jgi:hypothetical protein
MAERQSRDEGDIQRPRSSQTLREEGVFPHVVGRAVAALLDVTELQPDTGKATIGLHENKALGVFDLRPKASKRKQATRISARSVGHAAASASTLDFSRCRRDKILFKCLIPFRRW